MGTANLIVPLGAEYLELIAVVDAGEAAAAGRSRRVGEAVAAGRTFAGWAARTADLDGLQAWLEAQGWRLPRPQAGSRRKPDGSLLSWRTLELAPEPGELPFLIEWGPNTPHPGQMQARHPSGAHGIRRLLLGSTEPEAARPRLERLLGAGIEYELHRAPSAGVLEVVLESPDQELRIS